MLYTTDGGASWKVQARLGEGSVHFVDARNGWICGDKGRLHRTRNGGESWELRSFSEGLAFYSVRFLDPKRGLLAGLDPAAGKAVLIETSDGGDSWSRREDLPPARGFADAVAFPSVSVGYIGGLGTILATSNGGKSWRVSHESAGSFVRDLFFLDARQGWIVGDASQADPGVLFETGTTWRRMEIDTPNTMQQLDRRCRITESRDA